MQNIFSIPKEGKTCLSNIVRLSYFTIICNTHEHKKMDPGLSRGQLYDVQNEINIFEKHWLGLLIYYDNMLFYKSNGLRRD
jgi:hypothetical protein